MKLKTLAYLPLVASAAFSAGAAAEIVTITGRVLPVVCTPDLNGSGNKDATIVLPSITFSDLPSSGSVAGETPFTIALSACGTGHGLTTARAYFYTTAVHEVLDGRLMKRSGDGVGWAYQLLHAGGANAQLNVGTSPVPVEDLSDPGTNISSGGGTMTYRVRYRRYTSTPMTQGIATAIASYAIYYN